MPGDVYALLVGIDNYEPPVPKLGGCGNDVEAIHELLGVLVGDRLRAMVLRDAEATRDGVIEAFRSHLGLAGPEDVAVFYFSGHGSQEPSPEEFWAVEPDRRNETLVCVDSRMSGKHDLADKELAALVAELSDRGPHVLMMLDCCHSGSGVRGDEQVEDQLVRQAPPDIRPRPLDSFEVSVAPPAVPGPGGASRTTAGGSGWGLAEEDPRYVLLAACEASQTAKEQRIGAERRGVFSASLESALIAAQGRLSYADLLAWATTRVRGLATAQTPQLEGHPDERRRPFLGGDVVEGGDYYRLTHHADGWALDAGSVRGIPAPQDGETTTLAVYPRTAGPEERRTSSAAIASAKVSRVEPPRSLVTVEPAGALDDTELYQAVVLAWPVAPMVVTVADGPGRERVVDALAEAGSVDVAVADASDSDRAQVRVVPTVAGFELRRSGDGRLVTAPVDDPSVEGARRVVRQLDHVARWSRLRDLDNPGSGIHPDELEVEITDVAAPAGTQPGGELHVTYQPDRPAIRVRVRNTGRRPLFVSVLGLDDLYAVVSLLRQSWGEWLQPGQELWARGGDPVPMSVDARLYAAGVTEVVDFVKVIASTHDFAAEALGQGGLDAPATRSMPQLRAVSSTLDRLVRRVGFRSFDDDPVGEIADWLTVSRTVVVHRPRPGTEVTEAGAEISDGLHLTAPQGVALIARVTEVDVAARSAGTSSLPALLREASTPLPLTAMRALGDDTSVLELSDVQGADEVTAQAPLLVRIAEPLAGHEHLLPVAWDGEYWLPVGRTTARGAEATEVAVEMIPPPVAGERDLFGSVRILFRKVVGRRLGLEYSWPRLAVATAQPDGSVTYDVDAVPTAVAGTQRVLLYIHGIIGDTRGMVRHGTTNGLHQAYGAVLALDYENLDTKVSDTAAELARLLREAGFRGGGEGPRLDVVAHSMGGLVARWYVEHEGGNEVVDRLVLAGTPHAGSPWPQVQDWASTALGVGLNALGGSGFWPANILGGLVSLVERYDTALDDMKGGSAFLEELARQADPHLRYYLVAGERSATDDRTGGLVQRLRLRVWRAAEVLAFLREPNDIAVAVTSAIAVPPGRDPGPEVRLVGCDHMTYFNAEVGVDALRAALEA